MTEYRAAWHVELRVVDERTVEGLLVPWQEVSYLTPDPGGERFLPGSLTRSIRERGDRLKLFHSHDHVHAIGRAAKLDPRHAEGCWGSFRMFDTPAGNAALQEVAEGALDMFSVGFQAVKTRRGTDGVREIVEARLAEASLAALGAYDGARVLATREASASATGPALADLQSWLSGQALLTAPLRPGPR